MAKIFITGSADGLGMMAARLRVAAKHEVILHARNPGRAKEAMASVPGAKAAVHGDLASLAEMQSVAEQANTLGPFDAVIHNAAVGYREPRRVQTVDGLAQVFAINSLAPYLLTSLMDRPQRLIYISSGLHRQGDATLRDLNWEQRRKLRASLPAASDPATQDQYLESCARLSGVAFPQ